MSVTSSATPCILAMDTSTGPCSVAVWKEGHVSCYLESQAPSMQSAVLIPMVENALAQSGIGYGDLTALAVTIGPGSFTGIRVALAAARAICFSTGIPGMGYTTLDVLSFAARNHAAYPILATLNAGKGELYYRYYGHAPLQPLGEPGLGTPEAICARAPSTPVTLTGNATFEDARFRALPVTFPRADMLAELAACHPGLTENDLRPFYIRPPDAKLPQVTG